MTNSPTLGHDVFMSKKRGVFRGLGRHRAATRGTGRTGVPTRRDQKSAEIRREQREEVIRHIITNRSLVTHFQPIVDLRSGRSIGAEALSRFGQLPVRTPDMWFAEAASVGLGVELELTAIEIALEQLHLVPASVYVSLNASIETMVTDRFKEIIADVAAERIVLELTEHTKVSSYSLLEQRIEHVRSRGVRLAVDDAGSGYSGLTHILNLKPDVIKLDIALTRGIDKDPARRSLGRALLSFGLDAYNASLVAEGIETKGELETLRSLGCPLGQGFFLGRPALLTPKRLTGGSRGLPPLLMPLHRPEQSDAVMDANSETEQCHQTDVPSISAGQPGMRDVKVAS